MTGSAKQSILPRKERMDCFASLAMTALYFQMHVRDLAAQSRPSRALNLSPLEGVGNAGCPLHPQPRVRFALVKSTRVNEYTGIARHSRTQWF
jgi:hypothetical protein